MGTRDDTRRELRDLAKLATTMPRERSSMLPPAPQPASGSSPDSRDVAPTAVAASQPFAGGHTPAPAEVLPSPPLALLAPSLPPGAAVLTVPPARPPAWRGVWAIATGAIMAVAMVSGLVLGQALRSRSTSVAAPAAPATSPVVNEPQAATAYATAPAPPAANDTSTATATPSPETSEEAPAVTLKAPRPVHHGESKAPKPMLGTSAASNIPGTKAALKTPPSHPSATHDSLDELIRKSAAGN